MKVLILIAIALAAAAAHAAEPQEYAAPKPAGEWEILFDDGISQDEYARQMDFFGIELAAVSKKGEIQYASKLSQHKPERRVSDKKLETRLSIAWKRGTLVGLDRKLLTRAGISTIDKEVLHFYPTDVAKSWEKLERAHSDRSPDEIKRTRFKIRPKQDAPKEYEFYVAEQEYKQESGARSQESASSSKSR